MFETILVYAIFDFFAILENKFLWKRTCKGKKAHIIIRNKLQREKEKVQ